MPQRFATAWLRLLRVLIATCLALMVLLVFGNVVLRYVFNTGLTLSEELSRWLFVWLVFLGAVLAMHQHGHLGVDVLVRRLPPPLRRACVVASHVLMLWATWLLLRGSWSQTVINLGTSAPASGLPVAVVYAVGVVFGVAVGLLLLYELALMLLGRYTDDATGFDANDEAQAQERLERNAA